MSSPMPPDLCVARLRANGVNVVEMVVGGVSYKNHNRNSVGIWVDLHGITEHHTGSDTSNPLSYVLSVLWPGYSGLPGPLCQISTAPDGTIYMVGWGRCNHAGGGDPAVRDMLINDTVPYDREIKPRYGNTTPGHADGNAFMYGNEIMYSGGHPMTAAQLRSSAIFDKVICEYHGWRGNSVIGHREWSSDKPDPGYQDMAAKRRLVNDYLDGKVGNPPPPGDEMPTVEEFFNYAVPYIDPNTGQVHPTKKMNLSTFLSWWESREVNDMRQTLGTLGAYVFVRTKPEGKVWVLRAGSEPLWLTPEQWSLWANIGAQVIGDNFTEDQMRQLDAMIQPPKTDVQAQVAKALSESVSVEGDLKVVPKTTS